MDPRGEVSRLLRDLRTRPEGLSDREAARRLTSHGLNELVRSSGEGWWPQLVAQATHPLALLLWVAALLALVSGSLPLGVAIVAVIVLNAGFALLQERHAERAVEALAEYLPPRARVRRDGALRTVDARTLVPGDVVAITEGDRVAADARILHGSVEVDLSTLTGESQPVVRSADDRHDVPLLEAPDLLFTGSSCTGGSAEAVVFATGMSSELGRIAALSQRVAPEPSPLETQVRRLAQLIAVAALGIGLSFVALGTLLTGLDPADSLRFALGLLVANVPEGLLPTITLALAVGVRVLARGGALVKRLSAIETLGATSVICTDKTGTLTLNRMSARRTWAGGVESDRWDGPGSTAALRLADGVLACSNLTWSPNGQDVVGDATEVALAGLAATLLGPAHGPTTSRGRGGPRLHEHPFDAALRRMSTVDGWGTGVRVHTKGAPESVLPLCVGSLAGDGRTEPMDAVRRAEAERVVAAWAEDGLRVIAVADRDLGHLADAGSAREEIERDLVLVGLVGLVDPPRPEVPGAVESCHAAGIRLVVITGDHALTARRVAQDVGIGAEHGLVVVEGRELEAMQESELDLLLQGEQEIVFARTSPEVKMRIADAFRAQGHVVAMTGDGVNDAPALRRADIGVAMGRSGTDVAREAATVVLTDDNFATIVAAVAAGRQVYENVRKFVVYIFAHTTPEVVPFLVFAFAGGAVPLPLTVMQILAIDLGTETLPALALGREPPEPGLMGRPPRDRTGKVVDGGMLWRSWGILGGVSAVLVTGIFFLTLLTGGWTPGADVSHGALRHIWELATTMAFLGIVSCQLGTAVAARTSRASLRSIGLLGNPLLLWGMGLEVAFSAALVTVPPLQAVFGTVRPVGWQVLALVPMPFLVWGVDELWRWRARRADRPGPLGPRAGEGRPVRRRRGRG